MDPFVAYGTGTEESDNGGEQQKQRQASHEEGGISSEIPVSQTLAVTTMDLPPSSRVPLPLELNCEIFKCLKLPVQRKFIWGLGRGIYGMFGQKLLKKTKRVRNPHGNKWNKTTTTVTIEADGLNARSNDGVSNVFAVQPFPTFGPQCRVDKFPGTILYYYEGKVKGFLMFRVGLSDGVINNLWIGNYPNSYAISTGRYYLDECWLAEEMHQFELPEGVIQPRMKFGINVYGCGLVMNPENKLAIFFTINGQLLGQKIPINPTVNRLVPAVSIYGGSSFETNFGDDPAKPFEYDIYNCPGLQLACI